MYQMDRSDTKSSPTYPWLKERVLGTGGFGTVVLWNNKETGESLAIKKCRWGTPGSGIENILSEKHLERWETEVKIMNKLDHIAVVKCFPLPTELTPQAGALPMLCMEYCSGGDLRKVLNRPENCCGLEEAYIRGCLKDMSEAVSYLHSCKIIHRDLKPENIVLQNVDGQLHYKLIDLGYAKELDQSSACMSLVGTLQYLAPELHHSKRYSCTVDYWSLGLVTHEIITGVRPFLPNLTPAVCMQKIQSKKSEDICVHEDRHGVLQFRPTMFPETFISSPLKTRIEEWLKLMLEWDASARGFIKDGNGKSKLAAFSMISNILSVKMIKVFAVETCQILDYEVSESTTISSVQEWVQRDTGIKMEEQRLLLPRGQPPDSNLPATQCWAPADEQEWVLFVFSDIVTRPRDPPHFPPLVEEMLRYSKDKFTYPVQRRMYAHCMFFLQQEATLLNHLAQSQKVFMLNLMTGHAQLTKTSQKMIAEAAKLQAKHNFFKESLNIDLDLYEDHSQTGALSSPKLYSCWKESEQVIHDQVKSIVERSQKMEESWTILNTKALELQCSPFSLGKKIESLDAIKRESEELYTNLRRKTKDQKAQKGENIEMCKLVVKALRKRDTVHQDLYKHLEKQCDCFKKVAGLSGPLSHLMQDISKTAQQISKMQIDRQDDIWKIVDMAVKHVEPEFENNKLKLEKAEAEIIGPANMSTLSLNAFLAKSVEQNESVISTNRDLRCRVIKLLYSHVHSEEISKGNRAANS